MDHHPGLAGSQVQVADTIRKTTGISEQLRPRQGCLPRCVDIKPTTEEEGVGRGRGERRERGRGRKEDDIYVYLKVTIICRY